VEKEEGKTSRAGTEAKGEEKGERDLVLEES